MTTWNSRAYPEDVLSSPSRLNNRLARLLSDRGWSDAALGEKVGLSRARINGLKNKRAVPSVLEALLIADALQVRVAETFRLEQ